MKITEIILHHSGGLKDNARASTINTTPEQISDYHKSLWNFPSKFITDGRIRYAGYTVIYSPVTRQFVQCRVIGEETAHCLGQNKSSVGICIIGNYTKGVDKLTENTICDVTRFIFNLIHGNKRNLIVSPNTELQLSTQRIHAHRYYQSNTECYGTGIEDNFFRDKVIDHTKRLFTAYKQLLKLWYFVLDKKRSQDYKK